MSDLRKHNFTVTGVNGKSKGTLIGNIPCFGPVAYTPQSNKNGIALWEVETRYPADRVQLQYFLVHVTDDFKLKFDYNSDSKSYTCIFTDEVIKKLKDIEHQKTRECENYVTTVSENESKYLKKEVDRKRLARRLSQTLYFPSDGALIRGLNTGMCVNSPVTGKDVMLATSIYGGVCCRKAEESWTSCRLIRLCIC
jgi:hypothetical protein